MIKDVMETRSGESGFVVIGLNMKISGLRCCWFCKGAMWEKENGLPTVFVYLFVARERKQAAREVDM